MKIDTLIPDIYRLVEGKHDLLSEDKTWFTDRLSEDLSKDLSVRLRDHFNRSTVAPTLRLSQMGAKCPCALWHSIHRPEMAEPLPPWATIKFSFGHILEALAITLAKAAGHEVTGEQDAVYLDGIKGHRDCVIDGCVCDVKSASTRAFEKFKTGSIAHDDPFGYLEQLDGYVAASAEDPLVTVKDKGYLLAIDKTLGHMVLYEHRIDGIRIRRRIQDYKEIVARRDPPQCTCGTRPQGASGNIQLDVRASYSPYKHCCFPRLRTFLYASGPIYLTKVVRKPDVPELYREKQFREEALQPA